MDFEAARLNMVENQLRTNRIGDPGLIKAMLQIPREPFVPKPMRGFAYVDDDLDLGDGRFLIEPLVLARLLQAAAIKQSDVVLCIGDATGYPTAVISRLAQTVVALECDMDRAQRASSILTDLTIDNAAVVVGALEKGYPAQAPFDVIVFAGAAGDVPQEICRQLAEGGRLAAVLDCGAGLGKGVLIKRVADAFGRRVIFDASTHVLPGLSAEARFRL